MSFCLARNNSIRNNINRMFFKFNDSYSLCIRCGLKKMVSTSIRQPLDDKFSDGPFVYMEKACTFIPSIYIYIYIGAERHRERRCSRSTVKKDVSKPEPAPRPGQDELEPLVRAETSVPKRTERDESTIEILDDGYTYYLPRAREQSGNSS